MRKVQLLERALQGFLKTYRIDGIKLIVDKKNKLNALSLGEFLAKNKKKVIKLIKKQNKSIKLKLILTCTFVMENLVTKTKEYSTGYFHTKNEVITGSTDLNELYKIAIQNFGEKISKFMQSGSGWFFNNVEYLDIHIDPINPLGGSSYFPLPAYLANKKAIINIKNTKDNECFKWAVTCAIYPQNNNLDRLNKKMIEDSKKFDWADIKFPISLKQIDIFEKQNSFAINVFGYEDYVYSLRISKKENVPIIRLLLLTQDKNNHFCWIKNFSRLCSLQKNSKNKLYFCDRCLNSFRLEDSLKNHIEYCLAYDSVKINFPPKGTKLSFNNYNRSMRHPAVFYANFECFLEKIDTCSPDDKKSYTNQYHKHIPSGFCLKLVCSDGID